MKKIWLILVGGAGRGASCCWCDGEMEEKEEKKMGGGKREKSIRSIFFLVCFVIGVLVIGVFVIGVFVICDIAIYNIKMYMHIYIQLCGGIIFWINVEYHMYNVQDVHSQEGSCHLHLAVRVGHYLIINIQ